MSFHGLLARAAGLEVRGEALSLTSIRGWEPILESWGVVSVAGVRVSPKTATALSAYFACINIVASDTAKLPLKVLLKLANGDREPDADHPAQDLLMTEASPGVTAVNFREDLVASYLGWGHGYAKIERDRYGALTALRIVHPPYVWAMTDSDGLYYEIRVPGLEVEIVRAEDMLVLRGPKGWSVAREGAQSLGIAVAEQAYAANYLAQASSPSAVLETDGELGDDQRLVLKKEWQEKQAGSKNAGVVAVLQNGVHFKQISINPADAQLMESRKFSIEEVCRWFRVSPHKLMVRDRAQGWSTLEVTQIEHITDAILPHVGRIESEFKLKLFTQAERARGYYLRHIVQALVRGDMKTRSTFYSVMQRLGVLNINEIRAFEDLNGIGADGDTYFVGSNLVPLDKAASGELHDSDNASQGAPSGDKGGPGGGANDDPDNGDPDREKAAAKALRPVFFDAADRLLRKETKAMQRLSAKHAEDGEAFSDAAVAFFKGFEDDIATAFAAPAGSLMRIVHRPFDPVALRVFGVGWAALSLEGWQKAYYNGETDTVDVHPRKLATCALAFLSACTVVETEKSDAA